MLAARWGRSRRKASENSKGRGRALLVPFFCVN